MFLRVCFVASEIFHWGQYSGFGKLTRTLGSNLAKKGVEVYVFTPRIAREQHAIEFLEGMVVVSHNSKRDKSIYKACDADLYHSQEPSIDTLLLMRRNSNAKHIITFQNPMIVEEQKETIWSKDPRWQNFNYRINVELKLRIADFIVKKAVNEATALFSQAKYVIPRLVSMYKLNKSPSFLPNPVEVPTRTLKKSDEPTVCFLARLDPVKRCELFFELAKRFPDVKFIVAGKAHEEVRDQYLRELGKKIPNVEMPGFVFGKKKSEILEKSRILVNTSFRECLPVSFLEAAAHKCAILSSNNPDNFASNFGYYVTDGEFDKGLRYLLSDDTWREKGEKGYCYVKEVHELEKVTEQHLDIYEKLLG
jgi:glycosyltransferase involved in cell wall biosynthesis